MEPKTTGKCVFLILRLLLVTVAVVVRLLMWRSTCGLLAFSVELLIARGNEEMK